MQIRILRPSADLSGARDVVVVLDIFRAGHTVLALLEAGVSELLLVADLDRARALRDASPDRLLLGERGGVAPADFDGNNSPSAVAAVVGRGARVVLTTSAGTQALPRLHRARAVFMGTFAGCASLVNAIRGLAPEDVVLLPMGLEGRRPAAEDDGAARFVAARLTGHQPDFRRLRARLLRSAGAARLRRLGQDDDLDSCLRLDTSSTVPAIESGDPPRAVVFNPPRPRP